MDIPQLLASSGISIGSYLIYKIAKRYYITSGCHDNTLEIKIVSKDSKDLDTKTVNEVDIEMGV